MTSPGFDEPEHKATYKKLDLYPSVSQASRFEGLYSSGSIPTMPPPTEWPVADGSVTPLLVRATVDAHKYYGVFRTWKEEENRLGRSFPIPVVFIANETTDQYEAALQQRNKPHLEAAGSGRNK